MGHPNQKDARTPRDVETREVQAREETWSPPDLLPTPEPMAGYTFRWVRIATQGQDDSINLGRARREGFEPVTLQEQPLLALEASPHSQLSGNIEIGGLLLCKAPEGMMKQRQAYYESRTRSESEAVNNSLMKENDPRMPLFSERKTKTTFGSGGA